uniref:Fucosyltransferase n=1 Tax=Ciona savignyi TaxID=51511 RepID=H2YMW6_CIOSA
MLHCKLGIFKPRTLLWICLVGVTVSVYIAIQQDQLFSSIRKTHIDFRGDRGNTLKPSLHLHRLNRTRQILIWNMPNNIYAPTTLDEKCGSCTITRNRKLAPESDAIVIHYRKIDSLPDPKTRRMNQLYVWLCRESAWTTKYKYKLDLKKYDGYFNSTMTFKLSSEFSQPYIEVLHRKLPNLDFDFVQLLQNNVAEIISQKRYLVAWVVSNCVDTYGARRRFSLVHDLIQAGLHVQRFGRCFPETNFPSSTDDASFIFLSKYKFYLAFENAFHCKDYITEKFWRSGLYSGVVPIVWGPSKENIGRIAPKHSYIHVEDFPTLKALVTYLNYLNKNDTAYAEYFDWRKDLKNKIQENRYSTSLFARDAV